MTTRRAGSVTPADYQVLFFLEEFTRANGFAPSVREVAEHMGWKSHGTAQRHLDALVAARHVERTAGSRALRLVGGERSAAYRRIPVIADPVPASGLLDERNVVGHLPLPPVSLGVKTFAVVAGDDAMLPVGISKGSLVYVSTRRRPPIGCVALGRVEGEERDVLVVRRYQRDGRERPILVGDAEGVEVLLVASRGARIVSVEGEVLALFRQFAHA